MKVWPLSAVGPKPAAMSTRTESEFQAAALLDDNEWRWICKPQGYSHLCGIGRCVSQKYEIDGIDIDYEYPTSMQDAGNPADWNIANPRRKGLNKSFEALMKH
ncbi:hypothetical protein PO124_12770 [Bacillus licheniformis]|nr:hypothetical protein [Bacillus licheniformis]